MGYWAHANFYHCIGASCIHCRDHQYIVGPDSVRELLTVSPPPPQVLLALLIK
jgi:hypothetical protein